MDPRIEEEWLLEIIFQHLVMFQYYKDLKEHDNYIANLLKCEPKEVRENIDYNFLKAWIEKCAIHKSDNKKLQRLESRKDMRMEPLKKQDFITLFSENSGISTENFSWENAEVSKKVFYSLMKYNYLNKKIH